MYSNEPNRPEETNTTGKKAWSKPVAVAEKAASAEANTRLNSNDGTFTCSS